ncbi:MAG: transposase [Nitrospinae bacterium]|nr:transposase [Nitrospinota bacterium]
MARQPRFYLSDHPQHVIQRGNNRNVLFADVEDYLFYLEKLGDACVRFGCKLHAYVLMTNHVHLLLTPETESAISKVMQSVGRYYVQYFNRKHNRTGTLWEGRYKATLLDSERYLLTCYRYIELNPVRAKMVGTPEEYEWSSYSFNAFGTPNSLLTPHPLYLELAANEKERQKNYQSLFSEKFIERDIEDIRDSTNKSWILGSPTFHERIAKLVSRPTLPKQRGGDRKSEAFQINRV